MPPSILKPVACACLQVETLTSVRLDESTDKKIQINFNVTLFHLPCRFASVDIADVMGTHLQNVSTNLIKTRIDGNGAAMGKAAPKPRSMSHAFARTANVPTVRLLHRASSHLRGCVRGCIFPIAVLPRRGGESAMGR